MTSGLEVLGKVEDRITASGHAANMPLHSNVTAYARKTGARFVHTGVEQCWEQERKPPCSPCCMLAWCDVASSSS